MVAEARLAEYGSGLAPATDGWFVVNARDATWLTHDVFGASCVFESPDAEFADLGVEAQRPRARTAERALPRGGDTGGLPRPARRVPPAGRG